ncbi:hypothetical protein BHE74_00048736 [Ensete ventricosum]|nr:hypothetical protein BHE74_00048736 [Ensete ventricosum]RZS01628.1 hypothetical protein BHM03_00031518 [Ensete ventricosum]
MLEFIRILSLGVITIGDRPSWNYIGVPSSKLLLKGCRKYSCILDKKWMITRLFIGLLSLILNRTPTPRHLLIINS